MRRMIVALLLLMAGPAWATPTFDAVSTNTPCAACSSSTHAHTFAASTVGLVCVKIRDATTAPSVTGITINGSAATFIAGDSNFGDRRAEMWYHATPTTGNVVVTLSGSTSVGLNVSTLSYTGVNTTTQVEASATNESTGTETLVTVAVTTLTDNALVVDCAYHTDDGTLLTVGAGQTSREARTLISATDEVGASEEAKATAGAVTMSWTANTGGAWVSVAAALKDAAAGGGSAETFGFRKRLLQ